MPIRVKAFLIHLFGSFVIALFAVLLVFLLWYPSPLYKALNVTAIFLLLLSVDVTLGPLLTLLVFKSGKKSLMFDMSVILVLQISALCYGIWTVAVGRPAWIVFNIDRFDVVQAVDLDTRRINEAEAQYQKPSWVGPQWVGAVRPGTSEERQTIMFEAAVYGSDIAQRPHFYRPIEQFSDQIASKAQPLDQLSRFNEASDIDRVLADWPTAKAWLPLKARAKSMVVLLGENHRDIVAIVDLNPWY